LVGGISCPTWRGLQGLEPAGKCGDEMDEEIKELRRAGTPATPKLLNRAMQGSYPPASTFKLASAYAALKLGIIQPNDTIADGGYYRLCEGEAKGCVKRNSGSTAHGSVDLKRALTVSSDVYFYRIGDLAWRQRDELGDDAMQRHIRELGYGSRTGIDLPGESAGTVPDPESEMELAMSLFEADPDYFNGDEALAKDAGRWRSGFSADQAIGQKVNATPLQTANAYAALANGGTLYQPSVLDKITVHDSPDKIVVAYKPKANSTVDFGSARDSFLEGFKGVVDPSISYGGTAVNVFSGFPFSSMPLAGKTGTAQTGEDPKTGYERPDNSLFAAFTLDGNSSWTASAMFEYSGFGSSAAAPAVRHVLESIADGSLYQFQIPEGAVIDAEAAAQQTAATSGGGGD
ncbi:MAG: hypothetical protein KDA95_07595, partial [Acidimicrobiales bacterium]|nr:hypothetical protein [Acidimicrobiales bacterium]